MHKVTNKLDKYLGTNIYVIKTIESLIQFWWSFDAIFFSVKIRSS